MLKKSKKININANNVYNNILLLSRNKLFYTNFSLADTFENRIHLIFIHTSFLFIKIKQNDQNKKYKIFHQEIFDITFNKIELNMREIGYGDVTVNKNMKKLVKNFYNILLNCENFKKKQINEKNIFFTKFLDNNENIKMANNLPLINYFEKYQAFCFDLSHDSVLKGEINFKG